MIWNWIKEKTKKFKKWFIAIIIGGTALAAFTLVPTNSIQFVTAPENNTFKIGAVNYQKEFSENITEDKSLKYIDETGFMSFKPSAIYIDGSKVLNVKSSQRLRNKYSEVFDGIDLQMNTSGRIWEKLLIIKDSSFLDLLPQNAQTISIEFEIETDFVIDGWDRKTDYDIVGKIRLGDVSYLEQPSAWDSYSEEVEVVYDECTDPKWNGSPPCEKHITTELLTNKIDLRGYFSKQGNKLFFTKELPVSWLRTAQYPVFTDADVTYGTAATAKACSGGCFHMDTVEVATDKFVVCYIENNGNNGLCRAATVSGTTISYGTESQYDDDVLDANDNNVGLAKIGTDKVAISFPDDTQDDDGYVTAATISGTTFSSWATSVEFETGDAEDMTSSQLDTDRMVTCYNDEENSDTATCVAITFSGTTPTAGTPDDVAATDYFARFTSSAQLGTDKFVFCFRGHDTPKDGNCVAGTVAGTSFTYGSVVNPDTTNGGFYGSVDSFDTDKFVYNVGFNGDIYVGTVSGTVITFGTAQEWESTAPAGTSIVGIDSTQYLIAYSDDSDGGEGDSILATADFGARTATFGSEENFETGDIWSGIGRNDASALISTNKVVICYTDLGDSSAGKCIIGDVASSAVARRIWNAIPF